jgi:hypothetical protein
MKKILWSMMLIFLMCANGQAREWIYPDTEGKIYQPGDLLSVWLKNQPGNNDRDHEYKIIQLSGTKLYGETAVSNEEIMSGKIDVDDCDSYSDAVFTYSLPCDREGVFNIVITTESMDIGWPICSLKDDGTDSRTFNVLNGLVISPTVNTYFACPNKNYTITIPNKVEGVAQTYDGVRWYDEILDKDYFHDAFSYTRVYGGLEVETHYLTYYLQNRACKLESKVRTPIIVTGLDINGLTPPLPQFRTFCDKGIYTLAVANPDNYDGVLWFNEYDSPLPVHDGFSYERYFGSYNEVLYVEYYKHNGDDCTQRSVLSPIHVTVFPEVNINVVDGAPIFSSVTIYDHRDVLRECYDDPQYYHDLYDGLDISDYEAFANTYADYIAFTINNVSPFTEFEVTNVGNLQWNPNEIGVDYYKEGAEIRVCSDNITSNQGEYSSKIYTLDAEVSYIITTYDANGNEIYREPRTCTLKGVRKKTIRNRPPGTTTFKETCIPPTAELAEQLLGNVNSSGPPCETTEVVQACPYQTYTLGPVPGLGVLPLTSYSWSPTTGLSDASDRNPTISYDDIPVDANQLIKYTLTISAPGATTQNETHCVYLYKCENCGPADDFDDPLKDPIGVGGL